MITMKFLDKGYPHLLRSALPALRFVAIGALAYFGLDFLYNHFYLAYYESLGTVNSDPFTRMYSHHAGALLSLMGVDAAVKDSVGLFGCTIAVNGIPQVLVVPSCNGVSNMILLFTLLLAFPGPISKKLWFIPSALLFFYGCNVLRAALLTLLHDSSYTQYFREVKPVVNAFIHISLFIIFVLWLKISVKKFK